MNFHIFQHVAFEGIGHIRRLMNFWEDNMCITRFYEDNPVLPVLGDVKILIVMGGPMSVNDEAEHPWLIPEKEFIRSAIEADIPVLGICLGAQLIACALGATVDRNAYPEIGWFPVTPVPQPPETECFRLTGQITALHWHGDTFEIPSGAIHLAKSQACMNQAFQYGRRTIGLQFHPEITQAIVDELLANFGTDLQLGPYVHSAEELAAVPPEAYVKGHRLIESILSYLMAA